MRLVVREKLGAAYSPGAAAEASRIYEGIGVVLMNAAGDPAGADALVEACLEVARDLAENGVTEEETLRLSEPLLAQLRDAQRTNDYWLSLLDAAQQDPEALADIRTLVDFYTNLDPAALSALAAEYLQPERASILTVMPSSYDPNAEPEEVVEEVVEETVEETVDEPAAVGGGR